VSTPGAAPDTLVVGGGLTGLATANRLCRKGHKVVLLERSERLGGAVRTEMIDGFLCEAGPNSMLVKAAEVWDFIEELGLAGERVEANEAANKRFLVKKERLVALPQSPLGGVATPLYSPVEKLRLLAEPFIGKSTLHDESVTSFVSRRMGPAFLEYGISALVSGIFAGNPDVLSIKHAFPKVWNLEQNYGSLIGGALKLKRERKRAGIRPWKSRMISFRDGLSRLTDELAQAEGLTAVKNASIASIKASADSGWEVRTQAESYRSKRLVMATPLDAYETLPFAEELAEAIRDIPEIDHPPLSTLVLGYDREQVAHPLDGFGVLFPRMENRFALGCIFSTTLFPGRAPAGKVSLMCFIGGVQQPENGRMATSRLVEETVRDLTPLLGLKGDPEFHKHTFWPMAIPQYNVGHGAFLESLEEMEERFPGLYLRGNFRGGPGLNDCLLGALELADQMGPPS